VLGAKVLGAKVLGLKGLGAKVLGSKVLGTRITKGSKAFILHAFSSMLVFNEMRYCTKCKEGSVQIWNTSCEFKRHQFATNTGFAGECKSNVRSNALDTHAWRQ
jgi:hypothetical protein